jgi:hypothetical protein
VVDSRYDDTVASFQVVWTIIEDKVDAAEDDRVEVDGVGVVHIRSLSGFEMDEGPSHESWWDVQVQIGAPPWWPNRGWGRIGPVDELATHRDGELCLLYNARASDSIHPCDESSHGVHLAIFGCAVSESSSPTASKHATTAVRARFRSLNGQMGIGLLSALGPGGNVQR